VASTLNDLSSMLRDTESYELINTFYDVLYVHCSTVPKKLLDIFFAESHRAGIVWKGEGIYEHAYHKWSVVAKLEGTYILLELVQQWLGRMMLSMMHAALHVE